jgi:integrase
MPAGDEYVFTFRGKPWTTTRVRDAFRAAVDAAGDEIPEAKRAALWLHDIRHTVGAILASNGVSLEIIAKVLGHKSLETTRRYAHLYPTVISQAANVLAAAIPKSQPDRVSEPKAG